MNKSDRVNKLIIKQNKRLKDLLEIKSEQIKKIKVSIHTDNTGILDTLINYSIDNNCDLRQIFNNFKINYNLDKINNINYLDNIDIADSTKILDIINNIISNDENIIKIKNCKLEIKKDSEDIKKLEYDNKYLVKHKDTIKHKHKNSLIKEKDILQKENARINIKLLQLNNDFFINVYEFYSSIDNNVDLIKINYKLLKDKDSQINILNFNKLNDRYKNLNKIIKQKNKNNKFKDEQNILALKKTELTQQLNAINNIQNRFNYYKSIVLNNNIDLFNRYIDVYNLLKIDSFCLEEDNNVKKDKLDYSLRLLSIKKVRITRNLESIDRQIQVINNDYNNQNNCPKKYYKQDITSLKNEKQQIYKDIENKISNINIIYLNLVRFIGSYYDNYDKYMIQKDRSIKRLKIMTSRFTKEEDDMIQNNKDTITDNKNKIKLLTKNIKECELNITTEYNINKVKNDYFNKLLLLYQQLDKINNDIKLVNDNIKYLQ